MPEPPTESIAWVNGAAKVKRLALPVSILVGITAVSGAFVAGNDAVCNYIYSCFTTCLCFMKKAICSAYLLTTDFNYSFTLNCRGMPITLFLRWGIHGYLRMFWT